MSGRKIEKRTKKKCAKSLHKLWRRSVHFTLITYFNMLDYRKRKYEVNKSYILVTMFSFVFLQSIIKR